MAVLLRILACWAKRTLACYAKRKKRKIRPFELELRQTGRLSVEGLPATL